MFADYEAVERPAHAGSTTRPKLKQSIAEAARVRQAPQAGDQVEAQGSPPSIMAKRRDVARHMKWRDTSKSRHNR